MAISEKKKISNARWDKENMATLGCRVKKEQAAAFKEYAKAHGKTAKHHAERLCFVVYRPNHRKELKP